MKKPKFVDRLLLKAINKIADLGIKFPQSVAFSWMLSRTSFDYSREVGKGDDASVIMAPVWWIMRRFAEARYKLTEDEEPILKHDILTLLNRPNDYYSGRLMRMAGAFSYCLDGNCYLYKIRNKQLKPVGLIYIPHWLIEPQYPTDNSVFISHYDYYTYGGTQKLDPRNIIHIRNGLDPYNTRKGMSPLKSILREVFTDTEAANFSATILRNMGVPGLIVSPGIDNATVNDQDKKAVEELLNKNYTKDGRGKTLVMRSKTDVKQFGFSPTALDLSGLRNISEERVTAVLGVAAAVVGLGAGLQQTKVGATMKELRESSYEDCIIPMQNVFADEYNTQLVPEFEVNSERFQVGFDLSEVRVLQEDEDKKSTRVLNELNSSLITQAEARKLRNYEVGPEHEVYVVTTGKQFIPAGELVESTKPAPLPDQLKPGEEVEEEEENENEEEEKSLKAYVPPVSFRLFFPIFDIKARNWKRDLQAAFIRDAEQLTAMYAKPLRRKFDDLGDAAEDAFISLIESRGIELFAAKVPEYKDQHRPDEEYVNEIIDELELNIIDHSGHFLNVTRKTYETIKAITRLSTNLSDAVEIEAVKQGGTRLGLLDIAGDTKEAIFKALSESRAAGEGPYRAAAKIRDYVSGGRWKSASYRAKLIARTETKYCQNWASIEAYKGGGVEQVEIVDGRFGPPRSDEECIARNGQIMPINEAMQLDEHPNGTLSFNPVIGDFQG